MKKITLIFLLILAIFVCVVCASCNGSKQKDDFEVTMAEEITVPIGKECGIDIAVSPSGAKYTFVVRNPSGQIVSVVDGKFIPDTVGIYTVEVKIDGKVEKNAIIRVVDGTNPVIITPIADKTAVELGSYDFFADLQTLVATDDIDVEVNKEVTGVKFENEILEKVINNFKVLDKVGTYTVSGYVADSSGNKTPFSYKITTIDSVAPIIKVASEYKAWLDDGVFNLSDIDVQISDFASNYELIYVVKNDAGNTIEISEGKIQVDVGSYEVSVKAFDGYNYSQESTIVLNVIDNGEFINFNNSNAVESIESTIFNGVNGGQALFTNDTEELAIVTLKTGDLKDWGNYGYAIARLNAEGVQSRISITDGVVETELFNGVISSDTIKLYFKDTIVDYSKVSAIKIEVPAGATIAIQRITLCNLDEEVFVVEDVISETTTYEKFELPDFVLTGISESDIKSKTIEVSGDKECKKDGNYVRFFEEGEYTLIYRILTKTVQVFEKKITINVQKGLPTVMIEGMPLGEIGKEASIYKYVLANMDNPSLKVEVLAPSGQKSILNGNAKDGFVYVPQEKGIHTVEFIVVDGDERYSETAEFYVKGDTEIISYENNNGSLHGWSTIRDWSRDREFFNTDKTYVYSGLGSIKYELDPYGEVGTLYDYENNMYVSNNKPDVLTMYVYPSTDVVVKLYICGDGGDRYGYTPELSLIGGQWNKIVTQLSKLNYYGVERNIEFATALTGLAFKNQTGKNVDIYVDEVCAINHSEIDLISFNTDAITVEEFEMFDVPAYVKNVSFDEAYQYTEGENVVGIRTRIYKDEDVDNAIDITGLYEYVIKTSGSYVLEVYFKAFGEEFSYKKLITVNPSSRPRISVDGECEDMVINETYELPSYEYIVPAGKTGSVEIVAKHVETGLESSIIDFAFAPDKSGNWEISYVLTCDGQTDIKVLKAYVRAEKDLITFENKDNVLGYNQTDDATGISINTDMQYVYDGYQSLKVVFDPLEYKLTEAFGPEGWYANHGMDNWSGLALGYQDSKDSRANVMFVHVYSFIDTKILLDVRGVVGDGIWSKVFDVKEGWNEIEVRSENANGVYDFSQGVARLFICNYVIGDQPSGKQVFYIDQITLEYVEEIYTIQDGDFVTFETINGINNGIEIVSGGVAVTSELSRDWTKNGFYSLKVTYDRANFTETSLAGSKWRGILYFDAYPNKMGIADAHLGKNAVEFYVYATEECDVIFDVVYEAGVGNWSRVHHLEKGENRILLTSDNTLSGKHDFSKGLMAINVNMLLFDDNKQGQTTIYLDAFKYVDVDVSYVPKSGELITFESVGGVNDGNSALMGGVAVNYTISSEWSKNGYNSLKVVYDKANFTDTSLAGSSWRGILYLGEAGKKLGNSNSYSGNNALKLWIKASEECDVIFDVMPGNWSKVYHLEEGVNEIVISSTDTLSGTNNFANGIEQLNINVLLFDNDKTGSLTLYIDALTMVAL